MMYGHRDRQCNFEREYSVEDFLQRLKQIILSPIDQLKRHSTSRFSLVSVLLQTVTITYFQLHSQLNLESPLEMPRPQLNWTKEAKREGHITFLDRHSHTCACAPLLLDKLWLLLARIIKNRAYLSINNTAAALPVFGTAVAKLLWGGRSIIIIVADTSSYKNLKKQEND